MTQASDRTLNAELIRDKYNWKNSASLFKEIVFKNG